MDLLYILLTCTSIITVTAAKKISTAEVDQTPQIWSHQNKTGQWITGAHERHLKNKLARIQEELPLVEQQLISDIVTGSVQTQHALYGNMHCTVRQPVHVRGIQLHMYN